MKNFYIYGINKNAKDDDIFKIANFINKHFLKYPNKTQIKLKQDFIYIEVEENE